MFIIWKHIETNKHQHSQIDAIKIKKEWAKEVKKHKQLVWSKEKICEKIAKEVNYVIVKAVGKLIRLGGDRVEWRREKRKCE